MKICTNVPSDVPNNIPNSWPCDLLWAPWGARYITWKPKMGRLKYMSFRPVSYVRFEGTSAPSLHNFSISSLHCEACNILLTWKSGKMTFFTKYTPALYLGDLVENLGIWRSIWEFGGVLGFNNQQKIVGFDIHEVYYINNCLNYKLFVNILVLIFWQYF